MKVHNMQLTWLNVVKNRRSCAFQTPSFFTVLAVFEARSILLPSRNQMRVKHAVFLLHTSSLFHWEVRRYENRFHPIRISEFVFLMFSWYSIDECVMVFHPFWFMRVTNIEPIRCEMIYWKRLRDSFKVSVQIFFLWYLQTTVSSSIW